MKNTLAFLAAAAIAVGAVGYYLDWFSIRGVKSADGHKSYVLDVNTEKIEEDAVKAEHKLAEKAEKVEKAGNDAAKETEVAPVKMPDAHVPFGHKQQHNERP